jgi:hypothetical protein
LSIWEIEFICTSCRIIDINGEETMNQIVKRTIEKAAGRQRG